MKKHMNGTLTHASKTTIDSIIEFLNNLIECLKTERKSTFAAVDRDTETSTTFSFGVHDCIKLRKERKNFEKILKEFLKDFKNVPVTMQADVEMHFYNAIKKLEELIPKANEDLRTHRLSIVRHFHRRELHQTLATFKRSQKAMADYLYPDKSPNIESNPAEYQKLVDFWGDLAD